MLRFAQASIMQKDTRRISAIKVGLQRRLGGKGVFGSENEKGN